MTNDSDNKSHLDDNKGHDHNIVYYQGIHVARYLYLSYSYCTSTYYACSEESVMILSKHCANS